MSRRPDRITSWILASGTLISLVTAIVALRLSDPPTPQLRTSLFVLNLVYWLIWTGLAPLVVALGSRIRFEAGRRARALGWHLAASVVVGGIHLTLLTAAAGVVRWWVFGDPLLASIVDFQRPQRFLVEWEITMYGAFAILGHALAFRSEAQARAVREAQLESRLAQAQLQALQRQLQPHFLFNTLHSISALVHRDVDAADRMIERLGDLLRLTLGSGDAAEVTLARELEHVRHYLEIEQTNMGRRLTVTIDVPVDCLGCAVPALLLQPLVENSVRHGLAPRAAGGHIRIGVARSGSSLEVSVRDDGVGVSQGASRVGIGLENTRQRLHQLYGGTDRLQLESPAHGGVDVRITLPFRMLSGDVLYEAAG